MATHGLLRRSVRFRVRRYADGYRQNVRSVAMGETSATSAPDSGPLRDGAPRARRRRRTDDGCPGASDYRPASAGTMHIDRASAAFAVAIASAGELRATPCFASHASARATPSFRRLISIGGVDSRRGTRAAHRDRRRSPTASPPPGARRASSPRRSGGCSRPRRRRGRARAPASRPRTSIGCFGWSAVFSATSRPYHATPARSFAVCAA